MRNRVEELWQGVSPIFAVDESDEAGAEAESETDAEETT